jgi:putative ABC transport system substrate-binding protein
VERKHSVRADPMVSCHVMNWPISQFSDCRFPTDRCARRWPALLALLIALLLPATAGAGEIVIVSSGDAAPYNQAETSFKTALDGKHHDIRQVALKDVTEKGIDATIGKDADAVVAVGTPAAAFLHAKLPATQKLIFCMVTDPQGAGLNDGNAIAGVTLDVPLPDQFTLISQAIPKARAVGMLYRSNTPEGQRLLKSVQASLPKDWHLEAVAVDKFGSISDAIDELTNRHIDVIWASLAAGVYDAPTLRTLLLAALRDNIPVYGFSPAFVRAGALVGVGVEPATQGEQAAAITLKWIDLPPNAASPRVESPKSFQIAVNQIVADKIGLQIPPELLQRATFVFKEGN